MDHTIAPTFKISTAQPCFGIGLTHHFQNFDMDPEGRIIIKNFSEEFRRKLYAVLMDNEVEKKAILPVR